ncbi:MAG: hypothetical protein AAGA31_07075 [Bacteroidota bacterium]
MINSQEDNNFGLSAERFTELSQQLANGDGEELFEHIFLVHFQSCLEFVIQKDQAPEHLAYDATMDAFLTFRMKVTQGKITYGNLRYLLTRMARQHYYKRARKESSIGLDTIQDPGVAPDIDFEPSAWDLLASGWSKLGDTCKKLLYAFYYRNQALKAIALATDRKPEALRKQKQRCLQVLKNVIN